MLETKRLLVRPFSLEDLDSFAKLVADPEVMRYSLKGPLDKEQARAYLQTRILDHYAKFGFGLYALVLKEKPILIGFAGLISQTIDGEEMVELGYRLDPTYWGKGFASEACRAICRYAFDQLQIPKLISIIDPQNTRSINVAKALGLKVVKETLYHNLPVQIYARSKASDIDAS